MWRWVRDVFDAVFDFMWLAPAKSKIVLFEKYSWNSSTISSRSNAFGIRYALHIFIRHKYNSYICDVVAYTSTKNPGITFHQKLVQVSLKSRPCPSLMQDAKFWPDVHWGQEIFYLEIENFFKKIHGFPMASTKIIIDWERRSESRPHIGSPWFDWMTRTFPLWLLCHRCMRSRGL